MATPRSLTVDPTTSGLYHCISRCVRRAFLCGQDFYSGRDYEHRRGWALDRLKELAGLFSVEIYSCAVMSNHLHVVVRTLPQQVASWDDEELARRWLQLFPGPGKRLRRDEEGRLLPPNDVEIQNMCLDRKKVAICRKRLADISWFMRCLNEHIARRANREDECTGRFWEGRFKCEKLDDEGALLACMQYVDLNPIRAGIATSPENSEFTSAQDRIIAHRARRKLARCPQQPTPEQSDLIAVAQTEANRDNWLVQLGPVTGLPAIHGADLSGEGSASRGHRATSPPAPEPLSCQAAPWLSHVSTQQYLELLDWTGRQVRAGKRGHIAAHLRPVLERLDLNVDAWVENIERYGGMFYRVAGKVGRLKELARALGRSWLRGHHGARQLYAEPG